MLEERQLQRDPPRGGEEDEASGRDSERAAEHEPARAPVRQARPDHRHEHDEQAQDAEPEQARAEARRLRDDAEALHGQLIRA